MKKRSFLFGTLMLTLSGLICKLLGAVYRIPLTNILGTQGMGIYYFVFPVFSFILTLSSVSLPIAISTKVAASVAQNDYAKAHRIFKISLSIMFVLGLIFTLLLLLLSRTLANLQQSPEAYIGYIAIAPAVLLVSLLCAVRGYFQGLQNMLPTSISQIIEQITKVAVGIILATVLLKYGLIFGVLGALAGITISEVFGLLYIFIHYIIFKKKNSEFFPKNSDTTPAKTLAAEIIKTSLPFMLGGILFPLSLMIDSFLIVNILQGSGFPTDVSVSLFGINASIISTLINLPAVLSIALAQAVVPAISYAKAKGDDDGIKSKISLSLKLAVIVLLPCSLVFLFFAPQILGLLFSAGLAGGSYNQLAVAANCLQIAGFSVLSLGLLQVLTAILQGLGRAYVPVIALAVAIVIKIASEVILLNIPQMNIVGAVISNALCFFVAAIINLIYLRRMNVFKLSFKKTFLAPITSCAAMVLIIYGLLFTAPLLGNKLSVLLSFAVGGVLYLVLIFALKTLTAEDKKIFRLKT